MTQTISHPGPVGPGGPAPFLDCERLDCYRVAVEFQTIAARLVSNRRIGALRDQLDRASVSIVLNLAEGAGRRTPRDKAHFFTMARGSRPNAPPSWICCSPVVSSQPRITATAAVCWSASSRCSRVSSNASPGVRRSCRRCGSR